MAKKKVNKEEIDRLIDDSILEDIKEAEGEEAFDESEEFSSDNIDEEEIDRVKISSKESLMQDDIQLENEGDNKKEKLEDDSKVLKTIVWVVVFFIAIGVGAYFASQHEGTPVGAHTYTNVDTNNNYEFYPQGVLWKTMVTKPRSGDEILITLHHSPSNLTGIHRDANLRKFLDYSLRFNSNEGSQGVAFVQYSPGGTGRLAVAASEVYFGFRQVLGISSYPAYSYNPNNGGDVPVKLCDETEEPIIVLQTGDVNEITYPQPNCLIVQGTDEYEIGRSANLLLYVLYGVVDDNGSE